MPLFPPIFSRGDKPKKRERNGLWALTPRSTVEPELDIVAVHGLGGDAYGTWTEDGSLWLRDFLPRRLPQARIFTYGYDSVVAFTKSSAEVDDFARDLLQRVKAARSSADCRTRPLYFICHSLGGIVVKQALNIVHQNAAAYEPLRSCVAGIAFMGTPHSGANIAFWCSIAGKLLSMASLGTRTNKDLLSILQTDSEFLGSVSEGFALRNWELPILSFYELEKMPLLNCRIVEKVSAEINLPNESLLPIQADHRSICRFKLSASQKYKLVEDALAELVTEFSNRGLAHTAASSLSIKHQMALNRWLDPVPTVDDFERIRSHRLEDTCQWIDRNTAFQQWTSGKDLRVCILEGPPGCGKSTLASRLVEVWAPQYPVAYFFCGHRRQSQSWKHIICTWLWQLLRSHPELSVGVFDLYAQTLGATTPESSYQAALCWLLKELGSPFVVLDSLDENEDLQAMDPEVWAFSLKEISKHAKVFLASRPGSWIDNVTRSASWKYAKIAVRTESNAGDISTFLEKRITSLHWDKSITEEVFNRLDTRANGMFLWARFMIDHVKTRQTEADVRIALGELPTGLDNVYHRILQQIGSLPSDQRNMAVKILQWVCSSTRLLTLSELATALAVQPGRRNSRNRILSIRDAVQLCAPLLEIEEARETVQFVHFSALEYLSKLHILEADAPGILSRMGLLIDSRAPLLAATCITYLASDEIGFILPSEDRFVYEEKMQEYTIQHPFLQYAALNFWRHLPSSKIMRTNSELLSAMKLLFDSQSHLARWLQVFQLLGGCTLEMSHPETGFRPHLLSRRTFEGFKCLENLGPTSSRMFVRWDRWVTEVSYNGRCCSPLAIAAFFDLADAAKELLDMGVPLALASFGEIPPLLYAAHGDAPTTTRLLLDRGTKPNIISDWGFGALRYSSRNSVAVMPLIMELRPLLDVRDAVERKTAFHAVFITIGWHPSIVVNLAKVVSAGDLEAQDPAGRTPLHFAVDIGLEESIDLLWGRFQLGESAQPRREHLSPQNPHPAYLPLTDFSVRAWAAAWAAYCNVEWDADRLSRESLMNLGARVKIAMVKLLTDVKPKIGMRDEKGRTLLDIADSPPHVGSVEYSEVVALLLAMGERRRVVD